MVPFYATIAKFVNELGIIQQPWIQYLQQFTIAPPEFFQIDVGPSPFEYQAKEPGTLFVGGGVVSDIHLHRGSRTLNVTGLLKLIPVGINDIVTVTYSVTPQMEFIASYGQNTTS